MEGKDRLECEFEWTVDRSATPLSSRSPGLRGMSPDALVWNSFVICGLSCEL